MQLEDAEIISRWPGDLHLQRKFLILSFFRIVLLAITLETQELVEDHINRTHYGFVKLFCKRFTVQQKKQEASI